MQDGICWMTLGPRAKFFFTDQMNGCTFGVGGGDAHHLFPFVCHSNVGNAALRHAKTLEQLAYVAARGAPALTLFGKGQYVSALETNGTTRDGFVSVGSQSNVVGFCSDARGWEFWAQSYMLYRSMEGVLLFEDIRLQKIWPG
jgi:hypothetical protein